MSKVATGLVWNVDADINGTSFVGEYPGLGSFEETVARLISASGQRGTDAGDGYKVSVEFTGTFNGAVFTLYDYKGGRNLHIGGHSGNWPSGKPQLDVAGLREALDAALAAVEPTPYRAVEHYDDAAGNTHGWPEGGPARSENAQHFAAKIRDAELGLTAEQLATLLDIYEELDAR